MQSKYTIREILPDEFDRFGQSLLGAYSQLEGFPGREEHPDYYHLLTNIRGFTEDRDSQVLVAVSSTKNLLGGVVCIGDMADYGAGGSATLAEARRDWFRWLCGEEMLKNYTAANGTVRTFCNNCGSSLMFFSPGEDADLVEIALGCFDDDVPIKPDAHIYLGSGAKWAVPEDDLPRYEAGRDSARIR